MGSVSVYTDGSCFLTKANKPGGWAFVIPHEYEVSGGATQTTNNRMELTAPIEALGFIPKDTKVDIFSDSKYVIRGITEFIKGWKRKGWAKVKNRDLWEKLDQLVVGRHVSWHWVKAHNGNVWNERADNLAKYEAAKFS